VVASGVLEHEGLRTLYARVPGFVRAVHVASGAQVEAGELLIELEDRERAALVVQEAAEVEIAALRVQAAEHRSASHAAQERQRFAFHQRSLAARRAELATLMIRADGDGTVIDGLESSDVGRFVRRGDAVARLASGEPVIRALVSEQDLGRTGGLIDQSVECRSLADPGRRRQGTIVRIAPVGTRTVEFESLTHLGGGTIAVHDGTGAADQAYFEVTIRLDEAAAIDRSGATFFVRLSGRSQPLGVEIYRRALRFRDRLRTGD
jgi:putative peptide zinc metalloprotease protein